MSTAITAAMTSASTTDDGTMPTHELPSRRYSGEMPVTPASPASR
jgi:hypothetical protein